MPQYLSDGLRWDAIVVEAGSKSTAEGVQPIPLDTSSFERLLDVLSAECRQVERKYTRTFEDPCRVRILVSMLP